MAAPTGLLFVDTFDHYNTALAMQAKWTIINSNPVFVAGRAGSGQAIQLNRQFGGRCQLTFGYEYPTIADGFAYQVTAFQNMIAFLTNAASSDTNSGFGIQHVGDGRLKVSYCSLNGLPGGPSSSPFAGFTMALNTYYYIELLANLNPSPVSVDYTVRVNNVTIGSGNLAYGSGVTNFTAAALSIGLPANGEFATFDDLYITDGELLGDYNWVPIFPNAPGDLTQWTPNPAVANWNNTKEHAPDYFATYNQGDTIANQDLYNMDDVGAATIIGAHALNLSSKIAAGPSSFKGSIKTNATLIQEPEFAPSFGSWIYQRNGYRKNPVTGLDWTFAEINAIQRGALRIS